MRALHLYLDLVDRLLEILRPPAGAADRGWLAGCSASGKEGIPA